MLRVAIDGPSGAGKSTIAKALAKKLDIMYIDTGSIYRTVAYIAKKQGLETDIDKLINTIKKNEIYFIDGKITLNGKFVEDKIRSEEISILTSKLSKNPQIRKLLLSLQQSLAKENSLVMEGRDVGSIVIPDAEYKFYLTASAEIRSRRRLEQLKLKGDIVDYETVYKDIVERDTRDKTRKIAPLVQAKDAIVIDSDNLTEAQVLEKMYEIIRSSINV